MSWNLFAAANRHQLNAAFGYRKNFQLRATDNPEVEALTIRLSDEPDEVTIQPLSEEVAINYSPNGRSFGIEILDTSEHIFGLNTERKIALENLIPIIR